MKLKIIALLFSLFLSGNAKAQSWADQQKTYNDKANAETEFFYQQEELEQLRQESDQQKQELLRQRAEQERNTHEIKKHNEEILRQRNGEEFSRQIEQWEQEKTQKQFGTAYKEQVESERLRADNEKAADESELVLNNAYYAHNTKTFLKKGFTVSEARKLNDLHKNFVYRISESAKKGDAQAQFMLGMIYHFGFPTPRPVDDLKRLKKVSERGAVSLSWERQKEGLIEATGLGLEQGNDAMYVALSDPQLPIVVQNDGRAFEWFQKAAAQKHEGAMMVMDKKNNLNNSQSVEIAR